MGEGKYKTHRRCDVAIVGAGPAGSAAGILLARSGIDVVVVDRATFPRPKVCGDAISNGGLALLDELGARQEVLTRPHAMVTHASVVFPDGSRLGRDYSDPGLVIERVELDDALRTVYERSGGTLLQGQAVRGLRLDDGCVVGVEGPDLTLDAKVTIVADGPNSLALGVVGGSRPRGRHLAVSATAYMRGVTFPLGANTADHYLERELPMGYGWVFPDVQGRANVGVYQRADAYDASGHSLKEAFAVFIARHPERFSNAVMEGGLRSWSLPLSQAPHAITARGLLLAGDAAGLVDPLSGEGIWQAMYSGTEAAKVAALALRLGGLHLPLRALYATRCRRRIGVPSQAKRLLQHGLTQLVEHGLYTHAPVRASIRAAYAGGLLEMTKH